MKATIVGDSIEPQAVELAETRLVAYCARHKIDLAPVYASDERRDAAGMVNNILAEILMLARHERIPHYRYPGALAVFRRAIDSRRATFLHIDPGTRRAYEAW